MESRLEQPLGDGIFADEAELKGGGLGSFDVRFRVVTDPGPAHKPQNRIKPAGLS